MNKFLETRNNVFSYNLPVASNNITRRGSDWLWAVMAVMLVSTLAFIITTARRSRPHPPRLHYIAIAITLVSAFAYFIMASNLGSHAVPVEFHRGGTRPGPTREVFYVRWVEYFITFPLEILAILILARAAWSTKLFVVGAAMFMIVCHLTGALVRSRYKWGFLIFGLLGYFLVVWRVATGSRNTTNAAGNHAAGTTASGTAAGHGIGSTGTSDTYAGANGHGSTKTGLRAGRHHALAGYLLGLWALYPICWGVSEAGNVTSLDGECIFYGILDILTKPVFAAWLLFASRGYDSDVAPGVRGHKTSADTATGPFARDNAAAV